MKKSLLLAALAAGTLSLGAAEPVVLGGYCLTSISPDGTWAAGVNPDLECLNVLNLVTQEVYTIEADYETELNPDLGTGNSVANDGTVVITLSYNGLPATFKNGVVRELPLPEGVTSGFANGITADGSFIVGIAGIPMTDDDVTMQTPVLWTRQGDGTYGMPEYLPCPTTDWTGRVPQYVLAQSITDDGQLIAGQMVDFSGMMIEPLVIRKKSNGEWTYNMVGAEYINPDNIVLPPDPGEAPQEADYIPEDRRAEYDAAMAAYNEASKPVNAQDYMTEEQYAQYLEAVENYDWTSDEPFPAIENFMDPDKAEAYLAALEVYNNAWMLFPNAADYMTADDLARYEAAALAYNEALDAFYIALEEARASSLIFAQNNAVLSPNGRFYLTMHYNYDYWSGGEGWPVVFDLQKGGTYQFPLVLEADGVEMLLTTLPSTIDNNGNFLSSFNISYEGMRNFYVYEGLKNEPVLIQDYMQARDESVATWMKENMTHEVEVDYDPETWEPIYGEAFIAGTPKLTADGKTVVSWTANFWNMDPYMISYVFPMPQLSGIENIATVTDEALLSVRGLRGGLLQIAGDAARVEVFDLQGRLVYGADAPRGEVNTGLASGVYTIRATAADGTVAIDKAQF